MSPELHLHLVHVEAESMDQIVLDYSERLGGFRLIDIIPEEWGPYISPHRCSARDAVHLAQNTVVLSWLAVFECYAIDLEDDDKQPE